MNYSADVVGLARKPREYQSPLKQASVVTKLPPDKTSAPSRREFRKKQVISISPDASPIFFNRAITQFKLIPSKWLGYLTIQRSSINIAVSVLGVLLFSIGAFGLIQNVSTPFSLIGASLYIAAGVVLVFTHSPQLRQMILKGISPNLYNILYKKSIAELLTEPSPLAKLYIVIALSTFMKAEDLQELIENLPSECNFIKRQGLIHFLPETVTKYLGDPTIPSPFNDPLGNLEATAQHINSRAITTPQRRCDNPFHDINLPAVAEVPSASFEDALLRIAKTNAYRQYIALREKAVESSQQCLFSVVTGGTLSISQLSTILFASGAVSSLVGYYHPKIMLHSHRLVSMEPYMKSVAGQVRSIGAAVAIASGGMICARQLYSWQSRRVALDDRDDQDIEPNSSRRTLNLSESTRTNFISDFKQIFLHPTTWTRPAYHWTLASIHHWTTKQLRMLSLYKYHIIGIASIAITMLSLKLKVDVKRLRWIGLAIVHRLTAIYHEQCGRLKVHIEDFFRQYSS